MSGKRQPVEVIEAKGRKHLTKAEADERRDSEVHLPPATEAKPPKWLPKELRAEYRKVGRQLIAAGLFTELDRDTLGMYFLSRSRWIEADELAAECIADGAVESAQKWTGVQGTYFKQARQCAEAMGLSVSSRCRLVIPQGMGESDEGGDEFSEALRARQARAVNG